ncbi:MAG: putative ABC transporter permease [Clostridia bacterium]|nr:putative ABC transporter permease [Clostridia bacterium]
MKFSDMMKKIRNVAEWFLIYSVCGWLYEVVWWMMIELNRGFVNRGFLVGPWLPIYGFGTILIILLIKKLKIKNPWLVFAVGLVTATAVELAGSYICDIFLGKRLWNYTGYFLNFEGRIALKPDLYFALLILLAVFVIQPNIEKLQKRLEKSVVRNIVSCMIFAAFLADAVYCLFIR